MSASVVCGHITASRPYRRGSEDEGRHLEGDQGDHNTAEGLVDGRHRKGAVIEVGSQRDSNDACRHNTICTESLVLFCRDTSEAAIRGGRNHIRHEHRRPLVRVAMQACDGIREEALAGCKTGQATESKLEHVARRILRMQTPTRAARSGQGWHSPRSHARTPRMRWMWNHCMAWPSLRLSHLDKYKEKQESSRTKRCRGLPHVTSMTTATKASER